MSALRMCAYGVLVLPRLRDQFNRPLKQPLNGALTERAKIIDAVHEELEMDYPGWHIAPYAAGLYGRLPPYKRWRRGSTSTKWYTEEFSVLHPPIITPFGEAQGAATFLTRVNWQNACITILKAVEPDNNAWV